MKTVHTAITEVEAVMLQGLLEGAGIPVLLRSNRIPGYEQEVPPAWGDLLVPDGREPEAKQLIDDYLTSLQEDPQR